MARYTIAWMPGDGVGWDVLDAARIVLDALKLDATYVSGALGWEAWCQWGTSLPPQTLDLFRDADCALVGAVTSKSPEEATRELAPELRFEDCLYFHPMTRLRQLFQLHTQMRPCRAYTGNPLNVRDDIDLVVFRSAAADLDGDVELHPLPEEVFDALGDRPDLQHLKEGEGLENLALSARVTTRQRCEQLVENAFEFAKVSGRTSVTLVDRSSSAANTESLLTRIAREVSRRHTDIPLWEANMDSICAWLMKNPQDYDVLITDALYGEIVGDLCAGMVGGPGFSATVHLGDEYAIFEPSHGSMPKLADKDVVNPMATFAAAREMLSWLGETDRAERLDAAMANVVQAGAVMTEDMGGTATTTAVAEAVAAELDNSRS